MGVARGRDEAAAQLISGCGVETGGD